jgi:ubiquinone/menaquinone biosynthesis C-methylase UbiE
VLIKNARLSKKDRVLDVGCYTGLYEYLLERRGYKNFTGIDVSKDAIGIAGKIKKKFGLKSIFAVGDAERLSFPDNSFDVVLFFATLHHLPKKSMEKSLAEAHRVLRKGGRVVVAEPNLWNPKIIKKWFDVEKAFTRRFVPRTEKTDPIIGKIPILNKFGSQAFIVGIKK